jgi:uncharacterized OB-fold protein
VTASSERPQPQPRGEERVWFDAAAEGWLALGHCRACGAWFMPRVICPKCWSQDVEVARSSGRGVVHSFTVLYRPIDPWFEDKLPYVLGLIETEEGVRVLTNVIGVEPDKVEIGMPVEVSFEDRGEGTIVPQFGPPA